jgi:hypothetical protein
VNLRTSLLGLALLAVSAPAALRAQPGPRDISSFWTVKLEGAPSGQALIDELPDDALLIDDTGAGELAAGEFGGLTLTGRALAEVESYDYQAELSRENACVPPSAAFYMQAPFPMEVHAGRDMVVFEMEYYDMFRVVFLDGRGHPPDDAPHSKSGHSVGYWDGDTLVVDTTHLSPGTFMNNGFSHSTQLHMVERFRLSPDGQTLWLTQLYEDADTFAGAAARYMAWSRVPGEYIYPYECDPSYGE